MPKTTLNGTPLRRARLEAGLTQRACAAALDVTEGTYGSWERTGVVKDGPALLRLAKLLDRTPQELSK